MSDTVGTQLLTGSTESPALQAMDMEDESSLNHKNKKFCNDVASDGDNGIRNSNDKHTDVKSVAQEDWHSSETLVEKTEVLDNDLYLDPSARCLGRTESDAEPTPVLMCVDEKKRVITESLPSGHAVKVSLEETSGSNCSPDPVGASAAEALDDINDKIDYGQASQFWKAVPATVNGMLGGFGHISSTDINGSSALIKWIYSQKEKPGHGRCVDCGAGIGRITQRLLQKHFGKVDLVEQSPEFVEKAKEIFANNSKIGEIYCMGLQDFAPSPATYDVVWTQWVSGYLRDDDLIAFFRRMSESLKPNGVLVVKENFTTDTDETPAEIVLDAEDSSVTRPLPLVLKLASASGLNLVRLVQQRRFPKQLFKVYMLVFRPERYSVKALPE